MFFLVTLIKALVTQQQITATSICGVQILMELQELEQLLDHKMYQLKIVQLNGSLELKPFKIEFVTLTHSILEPNGLKINTPVGTVLHTGDWKCDPNPLIGDKIDEKKLKQIGDEGVLAMICDSTNVFSMGRSGSEMDVRNNMLKIFQRLNKRIITV